MLTWTEDFDDDGNSIWEADSYWHHDDDHFKFRLKQRLANNRIEWYAAHDAECGGETGDFWLSLEEASKACEFANENIKATAEE